MALALGVRRGDKLRIGDTVLTVNTIGPAEGEITFGDQHFIIQNDYMTELTPEVKVCIGLLKGGRNELLIVAPRCISIDRVRTHDDKENHIAGTAGRVCRLSHQGEPVQPE